MEKKRSVVMATGGSGGHVIPSETLARQLQTLNVEVVFFGHNIQTNPYLSPSLECVKVDVTAAPLALRTLGAFFIKNTHGFIKAFKQLRKIKPSCVVGFGSYHSFPVLLAAFVLKIPLVLYEANTMMGQVIKLFAPVAAVVASPFKGLGHLKNFCHVTPVVKELNLEGYQKQELLTYFGLDPEKKSVLIVGGSQGSSVFNTQLVTKVCQEFEADKWQLIHLAGSHPLEPIEQLYKQRGFKACVKSYEDKMAFAYKLCDLVICRSGSTTLFELSFFEKPAILIPFAQSAQDHQKNNALHYAASHHALVIEQKDLGAINLLNAFNSMGEGESLAKNNGAFLGSHRLEQKVLDLC
jgi:UDP-N-acetylglucosamine--N-acetylmuramyl-(pentapeptide) pyrophosphoryl-undecaprenol N-acetylglucosamine transferase